MKTYPSIETHKLYDSFQMHTFDKVDGSNLRFEWNKKKGWFKYGTRKRLFDESDPVFGSAIEIWKQGTGLAVEKIAHDKKWQQIICFAEFIGPSSFAGFHVESEPHKLVLFDVAENKHGIMGPAEFLKIFGHLEIPKYLGYRNWTKDFVLQVRANQIEGVTFEGVVGKAGSGHKLIMSKAKTQAWIDAVKSKFDDKIAKSILE